MLELRFRPRGLIHRLHVGGKTVLNILLVVATIAALQPSTLPSAPDQAEVRQQSPAVPTRSDMSAASGKIVFYRPAAIMGAGIACPIRYKGQELVELGRGKYAEWSVPAGRYIVNNKTASVEVTVDNGETRYVRCMIKPGFMTGRADLQIVDEESFADGATRFGRKAVTDPLPR